MSNFNFAGMRNAAISLNGSGLELAGQSFGPGESLEMGESGLISVEQLARAARHYSDLTNSTVRPQLGALVFDVTSDLRALDFYFPITSMLKQQGENDRMQFYAALRFIANHPGFDLRVYAERQQDVTAQAPLAVRFIVAGHLAEVFFYRKDILERFLTQPRHFLIYTSRNAFDQDGGLAGGDYNFGREAIQLEMSRLFEGFNGTVPGVAPILHELGHMLDHFEAGTGGMGQCEGVLPGMSRRDGPVYTPEARRLFSEGKRLEQQRYQLFQDGQARPNDPVPVGHPYVFQTDGEFIAGFLEMFFRNPNYFGTQNPTLYDAFASLLRQDPRRYWPEDFAGYVGENRKAFLGGQRPSPQHISIPALERA